MQDFIFLSKTNPHAPNYEQQTFLASWEKYLKVLCVSERERSPPRRAPKLLVVIVRVASLIKTSKAEDSASYLHGVSKGPSVCDAHPKQFLCSRAMAAVSIMQSQSYVSENPQKRTLWRVLRSSALGVTLLSRSWLHSTCFWQPHLRGGGKDVSFTFSCWKLFLKPKECSFVSIRQNLQRWKDQNLWFGLITEQTEYGSWRENIYRTYAQRRHLWRSVQELQCRRNLAELCITFYLCFLTCLCISGGKLKLPLEFES